MSRFAVVLFMVLAACGGADDDGADAGTPASQPHAACERYLSCLLVVVPQSYAGALTLYGANSQCWVTPQQAANCGTACERAFGDIASMCMCEGTSCRPRDPTPESCGDQYEPNDTLATAYDVSFGLIPVVLLKDATMCAGDQDWFAVTLEETINLEISAVWRDEVPVALTLLSSSGVTLMNGALDISQTLLRAPNVPPGTYYVRVTGSAAALYDLSVYMRQPD
jgi:hypothetical protein